MKLNIVWLAVPLVYAKVSVRREDKVKLYEIRDFNDAFGLAAALDDSHRKPETITISMEEVTVQEASKMIPLLCQRLDKHAFAKLFVPNSNGIVLMDVLDSNCIRSIPSDHFAILADAQPLNQRLLSALSPMQIARIPEAVMERLSEAQLQTIIKSNVGGTQLTGFACRGFKMETVQRIEQSPTLLEELLPECIQHLNSDAVRGVGPNILARPHLFRTSSLNIIVDLPLLVSLPPAVVQAITADPNNCRRMTNATLRCISAAAAQYLSRECWEMATKEIEESFSIDVALLKHMPPDAWASISYEFLNDVSFFGHINLDDMRPILSNLGRDRPEACQTIFTLIESLRSPALIPLLNPHCFHHLDTIDLSYINDPDYLNYIPGEAIRTWTRGFIRAISPHIFYDLNEAFFRDLEHRGGCNGINRHMLIASAVSSTFQRILSRKCVSQIDLIDLIITARDSTVIGQFRDDAFLDFDRLEFHQINMNQIPNAAYTIKTHDEAICVMMAAMNRNQLEALGDAGTNEMHWCHRLELDLMRVMNGMNNRSPILRYELIGPVISKNCLPYVAADSYKTFQYDFVTYLGTDFLTLMTNPRMMTHIPPDVFSQFTQVQVSAFSPAACAGLTVKQVLSLPANVKIHDLDCLGRMDVTRLAKLINKDRSRSHISKDVTQIVSSAHIGSLRIKWFSDHDWINLGLQVPEALNPCHSLRATDVELPPIIWSLVSPYCLAALPRMEELDFSLLRQLIDPERLEMLGPAKKALLEERWKVQFVFDRPSRIEDGPQGPIIYVSPLPMP